MDKEQALYEFWSSFGVPAYDEGDVPENAEMPYITYSTATGAIENVLQLTASVWYRSSSWIEGAKKAGQIAERIVTMEKPQKIDGGYMWVTQGRPFSQRVSDPDDTVRRQLLNVQVEFLTNW